MKTIGFAEFCDTVIVESLHPELQSLVTSPAGRGPRNSKQKVIADKIKDLHSRGEDTGLSGNTPKGSSRMYLPHRDPHPVTLDGKDSYIDTGTKVGIHSQIEQYHKKENHGGMSLGALQSHAENGDHFVNQHYRILTKVDHDEFKSNKDMGIFPPLVDHDEHRHEWAHVGHAADVSEKRFRSLTKTESHPDGITHKDFFKAVLRNYKVNNGTHWDHGEREEKHLDHVASHPLVQKFIHHQDTTGFPPHDWAQIKNMGVFKHPDGSEHIVARDHGFSPDVMKAYAQTRNKKLTTKMIADVRTHEFSDTRAAKQEAQDRKNQSARAKITHTYGSDTIEKHRQNFKDKKIGVDTYFAGEARHQGIKPVD